MSDTGLTIAGWNKLSFIDYPGHLAAVLFLAGCNLRCPWCHNPGIVRAEYPPVNFREVREYLQKRVGTIEGVVLSGGEPSIHPRLPEFMAELRALGLPVKLDTNGLEPEVIALCAPDYLALDIKTLPSRYRELGCRHDDVEVRLQKSIGIVRSMGKNAEIRITVAPGFVDAEVLRVLADMIGGVEKVYIQQFRNTGELLGEGFSAKQPCSIEELRVFRGILSPKVGECSIRGVENN